MITLQERKRLQELAGIEPIEDAKARIKAQAAAKKSGLEQNPNLNIPAEEKKQDIKSILHQIKNNINNSRTLQQAQQIIDDFVKQYNIQGEELKALNDLKNNRSLERLVMHLYNSILKFEGNGSPDKKFKKY